MRPELDTYNTEASPVLHADNIAMKINNKNNAIIGRPKHWISTQLYTCIDNSAWNAQRLQLTENNFPANLHLQNETYSIYVVAHTPPQTSNHKYAGITTKHYSVVIITLWCG